MSASPPLSVEARASLHYTTFSSVSQLGGIPPRIGLLPDSGGGGLPELWTRGYRVPGTPRDRLFSCGDSFATPLCRFHLRPVFSPRHAFTAGVASLFFLGAADLELFELGADVHF
jgi:hypothetical protein